LQANSPVERQLAPKDAGHEYIVAARGSQAFTLTVQQRGTDVVVTVVAPDGRQLAQVDHATEDHGTGGAEVAEVTALTAGEYRVRVAPFERADAKPATYTITLSALRDLTAEERTNAESEKEIAAIEQQWEAAVEKLDLDTMTAILRRDGFGMGPVAFATRTWEQMVAGWKDEIKQQGDLGLRRTHTISEHAIRAAGNTAVSTGRFLITVTSKDNALGRFSGQFVHVWARNDQGWKLVGDYTFPFGRIPTEHTQAVTVTPATLASYAGTYRDQMSTITVTVENGGLMAQWSNPFDTFPKSPLRPVTDTTFAGDGTDELTFVRSPAGEVRELIIVSDGPASRAVRVK
jgi:ketosteroid isomerase-like protein